MGIHKLIVLCEERAGELIDDGRSVLSEGKGYEARCNFAMAWGYARYAENIDLMKSCRVLLGETGLTPKEISEWQNRGFDMITQDYISSSGLEEWL